MLTQSLAVYVLDEYENEEIEYEVEFEFGSYSVPAKLSGPPENCYPGYSEQSQSILKVAREGEVVDFDDLPESHQEEIDRIIAEWVSENGEEACIQYNEECRAEAIMDDRENDDRYNGP